MNKIIIIRYGYRLVRDYRITTHLALVARALGCDGMIITDIEDKKVQKTIKKINSQWGGEFFIKQGIKWKKIISQIKKNDDLLIHLTMYGEKLEQSIIEEINSFEKDIYIFVGAKKVPAEIYKEADFNLAISFQPQSEVGALAIFLDRLFVGKGLYRTFKDAKLRIVSSKDGKKVKKLD
ncbi:MAG: tRNA (cytidine(56)-2'-O)-methyltransferase [Candidatus Lokiarchaeota archaeon]|nr:tRNA (cytidine(56)-2'-O)-methyltransferase [Candidatus Lokiarchaeota archaeon]